MVSYEMMVILNGNLAETAVKTAEGEVRQLVEGATGKVDKVDDWGKRKFAYPIKHQTEGCYSVWYFELPAGELKGLTEKLRMMESVVRFLITRREEVEASSVKTETVTKKAPSQKEAPAKKAS